MSEVAVRAWRGEAGVVLSAGGYETVWLPEVGMLGASLKWRGTELVAMPKTAAQARRRSTTGIPLLYPWANRLGSRRFVAAGQPVDLRQVDLHTDSRGLPIHGTLVGDPDWTVVRLQARANDALLVAERWWEAGADVAAFPFRHVLEVAVRLSDRGLDVTTTVTPTGDDPVPVSFGWHPYLRLPDVPRREWGLVLPRRDHLALDRRFLPTGKSTQEPAEHEPLGSRDLDDAYRPDGSRLGLRGGGLDLAVTLGRGYEYAQVYAPAKKAFIALEPMTAPTNALVDGKAPLVEPGDSFRATFRISAGPTPGTEP